MCKELEFRSRAEVEFLFSERRDRIANRFHEIKTKAHICRWTTVCEAILR
jgi:hypothetical protein